MRHAGTGRSGAFVFDLATGAGETLPSSPLIPSFAVAGALAGRTVVMPTEELSSSGSVTTTARAPST